MTTKVQWGVLGAANIAVKKVIPAMQHSEWCEVTALACDRTGVKIGQWEKPGSPAE